MSKAKAQRRHAKRRARERLGIKLHDDLLIRMVRRIQAGEMDFHSKQSNRVSRYLDEIDGEKVLVVYDRKRKNIVTVWRSDENGVFIGAD